MLIQTNINNTKMVITIGARADISTNKKIKYEKRRFKNEEENKITQNRC